jgi:pyruvate dehydrogenase E1 component beta subunit
MKTDFGSAIREGFEYLLENYPEVFVIGQGLWSPWYVGNSMTKLEERFGKERVIDTPVSESACTGAAVGAAIVGMKPIVVHPRMDFALYAIDAIVNEAAKWSSMTGGQANCPVTIRTIINRGGEQGAQHSQALHALFSHIPGLRVVMPYSPEDARDLLIASVLSPDPVIYIDDRWLYSESSNLEPVQELDLSRQGPRVLQKGKDVTLVGSGFSTKLCVEAAKELKKQNIESEVIDIRVLNPLDNRVILESVERTGRLVVVDGGWASCGFSSEIIATVAQHIEPTKLLAKPARVTLPAAPAPSSKFLELEYYPSTMDVVGVATNLLQNNR